MADCTESVFDDTVEIIGDGAGNKESLEGIIREIDREHFMQGEHAVWNTAGGNWRTLEKHKSMKKGKGKGS